MALTQKDNPLVMQAGPRWLLTLKQKGRMLAARARAKKKLLLGVGAVALVGAGAFAAMQTDVGADLFDDLEATVLAKPTLSELRRRVNADPKDALLRVELARANFEAGKRDAAVRDYAKALALQRSVADGKMVEQLVSTFGTKEQSAAANVIAKYKLTEAEDDLEKLTKHRAYYVRMAAIGTLEKLGKADRADYLAVWLRDLEATDCDIRRHAVGRLGDLGDKRAIDALRAAKKKSDAEASFFSNCLGSRPEEAEKKILAKK